MNTESRAVDRAISRLHEKNIFRKGEREYEVRSLSRLSLWRPIAADWWKKKEACIIGEDPRGNLYLRVCDGTVRFWDHETKEDEVLAPSVRAFLSALSAPTPLELKPGHRAPSWSERMQKSGHLPNLGFGGTLVAVFISSFFAAKIADGLFVILAFGPHAFFVEGLRVTDWKHGILSTGAKLRGIWELLRIPLNFGVWIGLIGATEWGAGLLRSVLQGRSRWTIAILRLLSGSFLLMFANWFWGRGFPGIHPIPLSSFIAAAVLIWKGIAEPLRHNKPKSGL